VRVMGYRTAIVSFEGSRVIQVQVKAGPTIELGEGSNGSGPELTTEPSYVKKSTRLPRLST
jgi:hypothetical protein